MPPVATHDTSNRYRGDGEPNQDVFASELLAAARTYLDVPFRHQGRTDMGLDCGGLIICSAALCGIEIEDVAAYQRQNTQRGKMILKRHLDKTLIEIGKPEMGAVALIRFNDDPQHLAILTPKNMIHAWETAGFVKEHGYASFFRQRTTALYRIPGINPHG